jgi:hypothetical protein
VVAEMIHRYCERHGFTLTVDVETFAAMVTAVVAGFSYQLRLDRQAVPPDTLGLTLTALWNEVSKS